MTRFIHIPAFIAFVVLGSSTLGQNQNFSTTDTLQASSVPDSSRMHIRTAQEKSRDFYVSMKNKAGKSPWLEKIYNIIIVGPDSATHTLSEQKLHEYPFTEYRNKKIRRIRFTRLDVFGPTVSDTARSKTTWFERVGNTLHVKTSEKILRNYLLFKEGDRIDPVILEDNERIFRQLPFIEDARILISPVEGSQYLADILIILKDQWSKAFNLVIEKPDNGRIELYDRNILGFAHQVRQNFLWDNTHNPWLGSETSYRVRNLAGSFIDSRIYCKHAFDTESYGIALDRKFITPNTKYAGSILAHSIRTKLNVRLNEDSTSRVKAKYNEFDIWFGRSFLLNTGHPESKKRLNIVLAARVYKDNYFTRPRVEPNNLYDFQDKTGVLGNISLSRQTFMRSSHIYSFGITEDIPVGFLTGLTFGPEYTEFKTRFYLAANLSFALYMGPFGYFHHRIEAGGFTPAGGGLEQGAIRYHGIYFSPLLIFGHFKVRQFAYLNYLKGINRFENEITQINNREGIRGLSSESLHGKQKATLHAETVLFMPYYLYGFRFAVFGFADLGITGPENKYLFHNRLYSGIGFGTRIRNERLVFPTLQLRFSFYPHPPADASLKYFEVTGERKLDPENFYVRQPSIIDFR